MFLKNVIFYLILYQHRWNTIWYRKYTCKNTMMNYHAYVCDHKKYFYRGYLRLMNDLVNPKG